MAAILPLLAPSEATAQRPRFATTISPDSPFYTAYSPSATLDGTVQPALPEGQFDPYDPTQTAPIASPYVGQGVPTYTTPAPPYGSPYGAAPYAAPPGAPVYAPPAASPYGPYGQVLPDGTLAPRQRLLHKLNFDGTWLARIGSHGLGITDAAGQAVFAIPVLANPNPVFLTPGFTYHSWNGPASGSFFGSPDLPPNAYDAYLDSSWRPQVTSWFSADLAVRVGVYSDFTKINSDSLRILGRGVGIITISPQWQVHAGIWYLDRLTVKLLPAGGVVWTPNQDTRFAFLFPNPKLSQRLTTIGNTDLWGYLA
ncbi:MAG TPA: hypothetical protein VGX78_20180, partial [Pirellulales bacterium]|nr:hypothetical protein [Pirellulales bacterium]